MIRENFPIFLFADSYLQITKYLPALLFFSVKVVGNVFKDQYAQTTITAKTATKAIACSNTGNKDA